MILNKREQRRLLVLNQMEKGEIIGREAAEILAYPLAPVTEFMDAYTPLEELPEVARETYEYHPDKARQLLTEAGYPNGFKTKEEMT